MGSSNLSGVSVAYLTGGTVRLKSGDAPPRTVESPYGKGVHDKAVRSQQRHAWKGEGDGMLSGGMLWGKSMPGGGPPPVLATSLARGPGDAQLLYSLSSGSLSALCEHDIARAEERRVWNDHQRRVEHLHVSPEGHVACSVLHQNGTANIGILLHGEPGLGEVTEGDSVDTSPAWVPGPGRRIVYQSAGVGRNQHGHFTALAPFSVQLLNIDTAEMETLREDPHVDYLSPRLLEDGTLYYIRRPHAEHARIRPLRVLKDTVLLPFRLLYALFQFFNFFSMRYTGRKLSTPKGTPKRDQNVQQLMLWGNLIQAQQGDAAGEDVDLVPSSWQLIRLHPDRDEEVVAKGVVAYDVAPDGTLVYSNGNAIFVRQPDGRTEKLLSERLIEQVILLGR